MNLTANDHEEQRTSEVEQDPGGYLAIALFLAVAILLVAFTLALLISA